MRLSQRELIMIAVVAAYTLVVTILLGPGAVSPLAELAGSRPAPVPAHAAAWLAPTHCVSLMECDITGRASLTAARPAPRLLGSYQRCTDAQYQLAMAFCGLVDTYPRNAWDCSPQITSASHCTGFTDGDGDPYPDNWAILGFDVTAQVYTYGPTS